MTPTPPLRSARLLLCRAGEQDLPALQALWSEPEVCRYLFDGDAPRPHQAAQQLPGLWLLLRPAGDELLGFARLRAAPRGALQPSIALHPGHRGQGFAQEALAALLAQAPEAVAATAFTAQCCVPDTAGDRLLRRLGFVACYECDGGRYRVRQYRKARCDYAPPASPCARSAALPSWRLATA